MASRAELYLTRLDRLSGGVEPLFLRTEPSTPGLPPVTALAYRGLPDGLLTVLTYGLSLARHADWRHAAPELCLSVRSADLAWARALGALTENLRGTCPFTYGDTVDFGEPVAAESTMTAFCVFAPAVLDLDDCTGIDVGADGGAGRDLVTIHGLYPIYEAERQFVAERGLEAFWKLEWDPYDVRRRPAV
ncbi:suppressor of fused domain protein [Streptomyces sp. B1866]|uniref:suppressor of fused domain protein n=1 Tax=Streptomyces sp. B1866 TaxID=3075431 RepID=UPI00289266E0|nr:suppressor of fused domain protein [Streptomyces sp. B1866]MDT3399498.1 suppressor of fused domain protein [Streptomyces sp. B1866]